MGYEILDHTADIGLRICADTLENLFAEAARGMNTILFSENIKNIEQHERVSVSLQAENLEELMHDWLAEINYLFLVRQQIFHDFVIEQINRYELSESQEISRHNRCRNFAEMREATNAHSQNYGSEESTKQFGERADRYAGKISKACLKAVCLGESYSRTRHPEGFEIKAVTYHQLRVEHSDQYWSAQVFFDL